MHVVWALTALRLVSAMNSPNSAHVYETVAVMPQYQQVTYGSYATETECRQALDSLIAHAVPGVRTGSPKCVPQRDP